MMRVLATGLSFGLPPGWADRTMTVLVGPTGADGFAPNIVVTKERVPTDLTSERYSRVQWQLMQPDVTELQLLDERPAPMGGHPGFQRMQAFAAEARRLQQVQCFVVLAGVAWVVTYTATAAEFDAHLPALREVVDSARFFDPEEPSP